MSRIIRSEELADCQIWRVPEVKPGKSTQTSPLTARQVEEIQKRARQERFELGLQEAGRIYRAQEKVIILTQASLGL